jgi:hypothetical protein
MYFIAYAPLDFRTWFVRFHQVVGAGPAFSTRKMETAWPAQIFFAKICADQAVPFSVLYWARRKSEDATESKAC